MKQHEIKETSHLEAHLCRSRHQKQLSIGVLMKRCYFLAPFIVLHCGCFLVNLARFFQNTLFYLFVECLCSFSSESGWLLLFIPHQNKKHKQTRLPSAFLKIFETFSGTCTGESISRDLFSWVPEMSLITLSVMYILKKIDISRGKKSSTYLLLYTFLASDLKYLK